MSTLDATQIDYAAGWAGLFTDEERRVDDAATARVIETLLEIRRVRRRELPGVGRTFLVFMDFDGTILDGDVTEGRKASEGRDAYMGLAERAIREGLSRRHRGAAAWERFQHEHDELFARDIDASIVYLAEEFADLGPSRTQELDALIQDAYADTFEAELFRSSRRIIDAMTAFGVEVHVVSAGVAPFVVGVRHVLPLSAALISGVDRSTDGGALRDPLVNHREGKAQRVQQVLDRVASEGRTPVVLGAFGNNWSSDGHMLSDVAQRGGLSVLINDDTDVPTDILTVRQAQRG